MPVYILIAKLLRQTSSKLQLFIKKQNLGESE